MRARWRGHGRRAAGLPGRVECAHCCSVCARGASARRGPAARSGIARGLPRRVRARWRGHGRRASGLPGRVQCAHCCSVCARGASARRGPAPRTGIREDCHGEWLRGGAAAGVVPLDFPDALSVPTAAVCAARRLRTSWPGATQWHRERTATASACALGRRRRRAAGLPGRVECSHYCVCARAAPPHVVARRHAVASREECRSECVRAARPRASCRWTSRTR